MPSKNTIRIDEPDSYYHVYARGSGKQTIFHDKQDFEYFTGLFARYLSDKPAIGKMDYIYPHFKNKVSLHAYCLMTNHFHLLLHQVDQGNISEFMQSLMISYSRYYNLKYNTSGPLFESRYKASKISQQNYLEHIGRYIHLNPRYWLHYRYSSLAYYMNQAAKPEWLNTHEILSLFASNNAFLEFHEDYESHKQILKEIKHELAS